MNENFKKMLAETLKDVGKNDKVFKPERLTEQEKLNRIYALAEKLGVKIGNDSRGV